ncbi:MAG: hypothetical protein ABR902_04340 [Candidatus Korobacteraceae bacterium]|jgi:hypothetical protein
MIDALKEQLRVAIGRQFDFPRRGLKTVMIQRLASLAMLFTLVIVPRGIAQNHVHTHHGIIEWSATLSHVEDPVQAAWLHPSPAHDQGIATVLFDFEHQTVTINIEDKEVAHVRTIEIRSAPRTHEDAMGSKIYTLYDSQGEHFSGSLTKVAPSSMFNTLTAAILDRRAMAIITTDAKPEGEVAGVIQMHKRYPN